MKKISLAAMFLGLLFMLHSQSNPAAAGKKELEAVRSLTSEVLILQRQIRDMQESIDKNNGQLLALVNQTADTVARATQGITDTQTRMRDLQTQLSTALNSLDGRFRTLDSTIQVLSQRLSQALDQIAALKQQLAQAATGRSIDPTDPVLVFGAAYADYLKGNYQLAIDQFGQFLLKFPQSEQVDDAQFWIGESYFSQGLYGQAVEAFDNLLSSSPTGDKAPPARLKKGLALLAQDQSEEGIKELRRVIKDHPDSLAAAAAKGRLRELGVPLQQGAKRRRRHDGN